MNHFNIVTLVSELSETLFVSSSPTEESEMSHSSAALDSAWCFIKMDRRWFSFWVSYPTC